MLNKIWLILLLLTLPLAASPSFAHANAQAGAVNVHPAGLLPSAEVAGLQGANSPAANWDEQLGESFTQDFTSLAFNVTAIAQVSGSGYGPAYLLNGLSNTGYWYQVGLSYDWDGPTAGFDMNYEVFNPSGTSIFPTAGGSGMDSFSGPVNSGDLVLLNLYFDNSTGVVKMYAYDWNTGASASETFSSEGATYFQGQNGYSTSNSNGFFTGLMTEWYHTNPYYGSEQQVTYSEQGFQFTSAWLWVDEYNTNTQQVLFSTSTSNPISLTSQLYPYSSNGATEYADTNMFITGPIYMNVTINSYSETGDAGMPLSDSFNSVVSGGVPPYYYYIYVNGTMVFSSSTSSTNYNSAFTVNNLGAGTYTPTFEVVDSIGDTATLSNFVFLTINAGPTISITMPVITYDAGQALDISISTSMGSPPYTITYYLDGVPVGNSIPTASGSGTHQVYAQLTDSTGYKVDSNILYFTVNPDPTISISVPSNAYDTGQTLTVSASTSQGTPPYSIAYYLDGNLMSGDTTTLANPGSYQITARLTDSLGYQVNSNTISLTVNPDPSMNGTYTLGSSSFLYSNDIVVLDAAMSGGTSPYTYTWYLNGQEVATTTSATYTYQLANMGQNVLNVTATDATGYSVQASLTVNYTYNYTNIAIIVIVMAAVITGAALALRRRGNKKGPITQQPESKPEAPSQPDNKPETKPEAPRPGVYSMGTPTAFNMEFKSGIGNLVRILAFHVLGKGYADRQGDEMVKIFNQGDCICFT
ncbi:MAG: hypothetical protein JRN32_01425 [Nitrososphaerota archaeon]|jgi:hypothetical protein|nr:hypothetical protein [Nitrososphaerota archaeon]MDG7036135.1 hypothetical protein [Nitrososphaerota archaeon]MDG7037799.1 hypothetical protein [Nitrososphaerota archaeon]MDG7045461.1 hypothetical protein [Nitrososphaerota archaeon]